MQRRAALLALATLALLPAGAALAQHRHAHDHKPRHGGLIRESSGFVYELVATPTAIRVWVTDEADKPVETRGSTARVTLIPDAKTRVEVPLAPAGEEVAAQGVKVAHVAADEGFWMDLVGGRVWVELIGSGESPYTVRDGDIVSFTGRIVPHGPTYPAPLGMCSQADYDALSAQPSHIEVPYDALAFGVG